MDFICRDFNSALHSLSQVIGISESEITSVLEYNWDKQFEIEYKTFIESNASEESFPDDFGEYILLNGFPEVKLPVNRPTVHWFHGARAINSNGYLQDGIFPLSEMYPRIKLTIDDIASRLNIAAKECKSNLQKHNKWLVEMKISDSKIHGGPFAMLMYEASSTPEVFGNHSYIEEPEIISNYAYMMYDTDADLILTEFKRISSPIIIEFIEPDNADALLSLRLLITTVLQYLYSKIHKEKIGLYCNTCFSNNGQIIPANLIVQIHRIKEYTQSQK